MTGRDFIERADDLTEKLYGRAATPEQIADNFALYGLSSRVAALNNFDSELQGEIDGSPHSLRRRAELIALRRKMGSVHEVQRDAGR